MGILHGLAALGLSFFAAMPTTPTYQLNSYGFGSGGTANSGTTTYSLEGTTGEISGQTSSTPTYSAKPGFIETQQANVPKISAFDNGSSVYYNKLHFVIDQQSNPSDALYALQISTTSNFSSNINYIKADHTIGATLALADYQTYTAWGGASGTNIIGLSPNTTYYLRAKATQGKYTESGYGPSATASTLNPQLSFSISPTSINVGDLLTNTVVNAPLTIDITFATNADSGGDVFINGQNAGLKSNNTGNTITSATGDLSSLSRGFGARITTVSQLTKVSPYDGAANNIGLTDTVIRKIFTATAPVSAGTGSIALKAKANINDPASSDYREILTLLASASF
jgi:hypothetical protein